MVPSVLSVAIGRQHTCALTVSEGMWCWGTTHKGSLVITRHARAEPRRMEALVNISSIAAWRFGYGTCATNDRQDGSRVFTAGGTVRMVRLVMGAGTSAGFPKRSMSAHRSGIEFSKWSVMSDRSARLGSMVG